MSDESSPIITVTATVMSGTVVRWFRTVHAASNQHPECSASRDGVSVHAEYLTSVPDEWIEQAKSVHRLLLRDRDADLSALATHRKKHGFGPLEPAGGQEVPQ